MLLESTDDASDLSTVALECNKFGSQLILKLNSQVCSSIRRPEARFITQFVARLVALFVAQFIARFAE